MDLEEMTINNFDYELYIKLILKTIAVLVNASKIEFL